MKKSGILFLLSIIVASVFGQQKPGYDISFTISGLRDSSIYLAYHFGDKQYITDTVKLDASGRGRFLGNEKLQEGIYMLVLPGKHYFEMLVSDDQFFSVSCNYPDFFNSISFSGSEENSSFITYQKKWSAMNQRASSIAERAKKNKQNSDSVKILTQLQKTTENEMKAYLGKVAAENNGNLLGVLVKSMIPIEVPDFQVPQVAKNPDSIRWVLQYNYNKDHFFDNISLRDERLLRTPILYARLEAYFSNVVIQIPDSLNKAVDRVISKCKDNYKVFQFISVYLFNHFRESQIMGHDAVLLKIADDIYLSGKADWVSKEFITDLRRQTDLLRNNLIGMKAKDLVMDSYKNVFVSLYDIDKEFTILYFWEPNCGHCVEETPKLKTYFDKMRNNGVAVFAVCTTNDKAAWTKFIEEKGLDWINGWDPERKTNFDYYYNVQSTPTVYILDRNKKIIAKKLSVEDIPSFIENYRKYYKM